MLAKAQNRSPLVRWAKRKSRAKAALSRHRGVACESLLVVFVFVDLSALLVQALVEPSLLLLGQMPAVLGHVPFFLVVDLLFVLLKMGSLSGSQLAILDAIGYAALLIGLS